MDKHTPPGGLSQSTIEVFWGEIAPRNHVLQLYDTEEIFLSTLSSFVKNGLEQGEAVIVIATSDHLLHLNQHLQKLGIRISEIMLSGQYIPVDAHEGLKRFMRNDWPDEELFNSYVRELVVRASAHGRKIRAFGELVAILWEKGLNGATVQLEHLWCDLHRESFLLYCAYPKSGFTQSPSDSIKHICACHSKMLDGTLGSDTHIYYTEMSREDAD